MSDYMVRATAADNAIRVFACTSKELVEKARLAHHTSPTATAALGRLMSAGVMMGSMMKGENDLITLQILGDGPIEGIIVTADSKGHVKGYCYNPEVYIPFKSDGHFDVAGAIGNGTLQVIRDSGLKDPYVGSIDLVSGEIAEDITYYFAASEQIPSAVALGVLVGNDGVMEAGGLIIQLLPFASEETISALENKLAKMPSMTVMLRNGLTPEDILKGLFADMDLVIRDTLPIEFSCNCSREKVAKAVISIGQKDIQSMIDEDKPIEVKCQFCNTPYHYSVEDLKEMLKHATH